MESPSVLDLIAQAAEEQWEILNLSGVKLSELPLEIGNLTNLTSLDLRSNQLRALPESIGNLTNLTSLDLRLNRFQDLPESIGNLTKLTSLDIWNNQLTALPESIGNLTNLTSLDLSGNYLKTLPESIGNLTRLTSLNLRNNRLKTLPESIGNLTSLTSLNINENSLSQILPEIVATGGLAVRDYYQQRLEEKSDYIYEAKLLIIGEGGAGKTSLANKLIDSTYPLKLESSDQPEKSTEGIDVLRLDFPHASGKPFRINIWDFGGQEIYHATHQFFLTKRSLYLLVADTRQDNTNFNYWLEVVELLSEASPTLIVKNEKQDRPCQVNETQLRGRFPNLEKILPTNLVDNRGLPDILTAVKHHISQLPHIGQPLPKTWVRVRAALEADTRNYITQTEFLDLCNTHGFKRSENALQLSGYLHDLGVCLHFQDDPILKNIVILKPEWGTTAVYKVIDTKQVSQNLGCFSQADLTEIWVDEQYATMRHELLQLMKNFKLCYEIPNRPKNYIAPQLLSPNQPEYTWTDTDNLILRYHYDFMPKGIITRFTVEMHRLIDSDLVWKEGIILIEENVRAEVIETYSKNEIRVRVSGFPKKDLLTRIRHEFDKIHNSYEKLRYQELIPCNCPPCKGSQNPHAYALKKLQERIENKAYEAECDRPPYHKVKVYSLMDDAIGRSQSAQTTEIDRYTEETSSTTNIIINAGNSLVTDQSPKTQNFNAPMSGVIASDNPLVIGNTFNQTNNADTIELLKLVTTLRQTAAQFPTEIQEGAIIDIEDLETEIQKPTDQRSIPRLKRSLIALFAIAGTIAAPIAGMTDFTNNVLEIANKLHIELPKLP
jgi:internalin A